jgi:hypothetical protein
MDNMGGMAVEVLFAPLDYFAVIKKLKTTTAPGDSVTIDGSHTFKDGYGFHKAFATIESVKKMLESQGEIAGRSKKAKAEFFYPGTSKAAAEFDRQAQNDEFIFLFKDPNTGKRLQLGSEDYPAIVSANYDSATPASGRKGFAFTAEANQLGMQFYEGDIELAPEYGSSGAEDESTYVD